MRVAVVASAQIFGGFQNLPPPQSLDFSAFFGLSHLFPPRLSISVIFDTDLVTLHISYGNTNEKNKQAQYAYYSAGNSKIKYKHNGTSTAAYWWLRSPNASYSNYFVNVYTDGTVYTSGAFFSLGFAPGFCV